MTESRLKLSKLTERAQEEGQNRESPRPPLHMVTHCKTNKPKSAAEHQDEEETSVIHRDRGGEQVRPSNTVKHGGGTIMLWDFGADTELTG